jgi:hypothetical protein|tara:strand:+ start:255 stop:476 length:222 start_codon:yes stop_codon:yes gene_type:complete
MKNRKVKVNGSAPGPSAKAVGYADIKDQGRIPYGKTADVKMYATNSYEPHSGMKRGTVRGMGAATKGGGYWEC